MKSVTDIEALALARLAARVMKKLPPTVSKTSLPAAFCLVDSDGGRMGAGRFWPAMPSPIHAAERGGRSCRSPTWN